MKYLDWDKGKNKLLIEQLGISFEEVVLAISEGAETLASSIIHRSVD